MSMQYWPPSQDDVMTLAEALDDISDEKFAQYSRAKGRTTAPPMRLALDVLETPEVFEIHASVPGVEPELIEISVEGDTVRIAGERTSIDTGRMTEDADYRWLVRERQLGHFDRTVSLPSHVDVNRTTADFIDGVLVVSLPKIVAPVGRTIPVRAGRLPQDRADIIEV